MVWHYGPGGLNSVSSIDFLHALTADGEIGQLLTIRNANVTMESLRGESWGESWGDGKECAMENTMLRGGRLCSVELTVNMRNRPLDGQAENWLSLMNFKVRKVEGGAKLRAPPRYVFSKVA
jgi:hypothetical protein